MDRYAAIVHPTSTGAVIAEEFRAQGCHPIAIWTGSHGESQTEFHRELQGTDVCELANDLTASCGDNLVAVVPGGERGVTVADALSAHLKMRTNGICHGDRRSKSNQQELLRKANLPGVREACGRSWEEVQAFAESEMMPVLVKPSESAGSDGVKKCLTIAEAEEHFKKLSATPPQVGPPDAPVLIQQFLHGPEYVVDQVSCHGKHKVMMVYKYDKQPANGADFVYFAVEPVPMNDSKVPELVMYAQKVLDAMGILYGPTHGEFILTEEGPRLVEMNCRAQGADGSWAPLCRALTGGYSQIEIAVHSYISDEEFDKCPEQPPVPFKASGIEICFVSRVEGVISGTPGFDMVRSLDSFHELFTDVEVGSEVQRTIDPATGVGSVILIHPDDKVLKRDIRLIREMENAGKFFELQETPSEPQHLSSEVFRDRSRSPRR